MDDVCESKKPDKEGQECSKKRHGDDNVASTAHLATLDRILTVCRGHSRYTACGPKCFDPRGLVSTSLLDGCSYTCRNSCIRSRYECRRDDMEKFDWSNYWSAVFDSIWSGGTFCMQIWGTVKHTTHDSLLPESSFRRRESHVRKTALQLTPL